MRGIGSAGFPQHAASCSELSPQPQLACLPAWGRLRHNRHLACAKGAAMSTSLLTCSTVASLNPDWFPQPHPSVGGGSTHCSLLRQLPLLHCAWHDAQAYYLAQCCPWGGCGRVMRHSKLCALKAMYSSGPPCPLHAQDVCVYRHDLKPAGHQQKYVTTCMQMRGTRQNMYWLRQSSSSSKSRQTHCLALPCQLPAGSQQGHRLRVHFACWVQQGTSPSWTQCSGPRLMLAASPGPPTPNPDLSTLHPKPCTLARQGPCLSCREKARKRLSVSCQEDSCQVMSSGLGKAARPSKGWLRLNLMRLLHTRQPSLMCAYGRFYRRLNKRPWSVKGCV